MTIKEKIKACDYVINNMLDEQQRIVMRNENKIIQLNTAQFEDGMGSDNRPLNNKNSIFTGHYKYSKPFKDAGNLYDFYVTGSFLGGLQLEMKSNLVQFDIFSTGTGSGKKHDFFAGYTNLYGLDTESERILNYEIIKPQLLTWIKKYL